MAVARHATLRSNLSVGPAARLLRFDLPEGETLGDTLGGEYIIVHTGLTNGQGKPLKRTYSLVHVDTAAGSFELAVHPLREGTASTLLGGLGLGATLTFSGPWGKKAPPHPDAEVFLVGTDTGLSSLCGWASGPGFTDWAPRTRALWMRDEAAGFCSSTWARGRVEPYRVDLRICELPPVHDAARVDVALGHLARFTAPPKDAGRPVHALLAGDGALLPAMKAFLLARGAPESAVVVEPFFNKPEKASG